VNYQEMLKEKTITAEEAVLKVKDNSTIYSYGTSGEPQTFLEGLSSLAGKRHDLTYVATQNTVPHDFYTNENCRDIFTIESMFFNRFCTQYQIDGRMSYIPVSLRNTFPDRDYYNRIRGEHVNIYVIAVTPMDSHGYFSTGTVAMSNRELVEAADMVILEINENVPRTFGDTYIHITEADYVFQGDNQMYYLPERPAKEEDMVIGNYIADLIDDGSTIQLGIGDIPNAVASALKDKHDLGVHTEMLNNAMIGLYKAGVITNHKKTLYRDRIVTTFSLGSKESYDFIDNNVGVLHLDVTKTNDPYVIAQNDNMVSVNTTLQIDLMGQCASEAIGTLQISGIGGQSETMIGAKMSRNGKAIIALHSTAMVKGSDGIRRRKSCIVSAHPSGTVISLLRSDIDYVVTEYGTAALRGASLAERARALINIAHPDYREELTQEAHSLYLL
jgi:acyl-CoA hydrolase